ncbi:MAG: hypothetical protein M1821_003133 [Bathelium mastoideum]|nr:MAG: hypothetical protein M1821_003133 [Bathelium mastoideum]
MKFTVIFTLTTIAFSLGALAHPSPPPKPTPKPAPESAPERGPKVSHEELNHILSAIRQSEAHGHPSASSSHAVPTAASPALQSDDGGVAPNPSTGEDLSGGNTNDDALYNEDHDGISWY